MKGLYIIRPGGPCARRLGRAPMEVAMLQELSSSEPSTSHVWKRGGWPKQLKRKSRYMCNQMRTAIA